MECPITPASAIERRKRWIPRVLVGQVPEPEEVEWQGLVTEAARRFIAEYGDLPEILHVGSTPGLTISIRLLSSSGRAIRRPEASRDTGHLPVLSCRTEKPVGDEVEAFKKTWHAILSRLFGWPDSTIPDLIGNQEWVFRSLFLPPRPSL